jgi:DNA-binding beta-propeller fold protein YncE
MQKRCFRFFLRIILSILFFAAATACSRRQPSSGPAQNIYLTIPDKHTIAIFPGEITESTQPLAKIVEDPPDQPVDVSLDLAREVFVANVNGNVKAYREHNHRFMQIHLLEGPNTGIVHPQAIAVDMAGSFFVADAGEARGRGRVSWFPGGLNGNVPPARVISGPHTGITNPTGLAMDGSGRIYVADQGSDKVLVFDSDANGDVPPAATISPLHSPQRVFVDQFLNVYVSNKGDDTISIFENEGPENWNPSATLSSGILHDPRGVATDGTGRIAVAAPGRVLFFAPNSKGAAQPIAILSLGAQIDPMGLCIR